MTTGEFVKQWDDGPDSFSKDPPNATVSVLGGDGTDISDAVVTLKSPKLEGTTLTFEVAVLEGSLTGSSGPAAVFIDHSGGWHGRGAWYGVGAFATGAALGAALASPGPVYPITYYPPYPEPYYSGAACPPGYWIGPWGHCRNMPYHGRLTCFRINERKVKDYSRANIFLAGDAAHVHSPAGGQGMNTGMQDAFNLAWKLAMVCGGACNRDLLATYSLERSAVGEMVLRNASRMTSAALLSNPIAQEIRNDLVHFLLGFSSVQRRAVRTLAETDIAYPNSPLSVTVLNAHANVGPAPGSGFAPPSEDYPKRRSVIMRGS